MPGRALAPEDLHPRQYGGGNLEMVYFEEQMKNSSSYTRGILKLRFFFYLSDQMRDCHAVLTRLP